MRIGLIDGDLSSKFTNILNIDLMKINAYYKGRRDIVSLLSKKDELSKFSKLFYYRDYPIGLLPKEVLDIPIIEVGGEAFGLSLPEDIERCVPDISFYIPVLDKYMGNNPKTKVYIKIRMLKESSHIRLSANGKLCENIEKSIDPRSKNLSVYDKNIAALDDWYEILKELTYKSDKQKRSISTKFPIYIKNEDFFRKINTFTFNQYFSSFILDANCDDELYNIWRKDINKTLKLRYKFNCFTEPRNYSNEEIIQTASKIVSRDSFSQNSGYRFLLYYERGTLPEPFNTYIEIISRWNHYKYMRENCKDFSLIQYIKTYCKLEEKDKIKEAMRLEPELKDILLEKR